MKGGVSAIATLMWHGVGNPAVHVTTLAVRQLDLTNCVGVDKVECIRTLHHGTADVELNYNPRLGGDARPVDPQRPYGSGSQ
jgi:hypothetical protein